MKLFWSDRSPFVRKVMIVLHETGLVDRVERISAVVAMSAPPNQDVIAHNPLGKIPVLLTAEGPLFDSRVICEYLDLHAGTALFPSNLQARMQALCWQALADGILDILLLWRNELNRPGGPWQNVCNGYNIKICAAIAKLNADACTMAAAPFGIGHIAVICALGYLDFRWGGSRWETAFPDLAALYDSLKQRPSVRSHPVGEQLAPPPYPSTPLIFQEAR